MAIEDRTSEKSERGLLSNLNARLEAMHGVLVLMAGHQAVIGSASAHALQGARHLLVEGMKLTHQLQQVPRDAELLDALDRTMSGIIGIVDLALPDNARHRYAHLSAALDGLDTLTADAVATVDELVRFIRTPAAA